MKYIVTTFKWVNWGKNHTFTNWREARDYCREARNSGKYVNVKFTAVPVK